MVYGYFVISSVTGLLSPSPSRIASQELDASTGASEPHDLAVRLNAVRHKRIRVHRIPHQRS
jgi:hypothetical protein